MTCTTIIEVINNTVAVKGDWKHFTYEISKTTEPIELRFSGIIEGVHKLAVLKFQSNPIKLSIKPKIRNSG